MDGEQVTTALYDTMLAAHKDQFGEVSVKMRHYLRGLAGELTTRMGFTRELYAPSTKSSVQQRVTSRARERWPQLGQVRVRFRGGFAYIEATDADGEVLRLCRLRYAGYANQWGFAIYRASHDDYQDSSLPSGLGGGSAEEALDTACGLYLGDPTGWSQPPTN